jgi:hypothetical protein
MRSQLPWLLELLAEVPARLVASLLCPSLYLSFLSMVMFGFV